MKHRGIGVYFTAVGIRSSSVTFHWNSGFWLLVAGYWLLVAGYWLLVTGCWCQVSKALLDDLEQDFKMIHNVGLQFSLHEATGRTMVKVINKDTDDLIREIPPEEILNLAAKLDEMVGVLFDHAA